MKKVTLIIGTLIISLNFCSCGNKPFSKYDFSKGEYKLYFCYQANDYDLVPGTFKTPEFVEKFGNFYITDKNTLEFIQQNAIKDEVIVSNPLNSFYSLRLTCNGKAIDGAILDIDNKEIVTENGKYKFNLTELEKFDSQFKKLNSYKVYCPSISCINKLTSFVNSKHGFIYYGIQGERNPFREFSGKIDLITLVNQNDFSGGYKKIRKQFESELNKIGKGQIFNFEYDGGDTLKISRLWDKDYTTNLPDRFRVTKAYSDSIDFPIAAYDIEKSDLIEFFVNEKVKSYTVEDLKN